MFWGIVVHSSSRLCSQSHFFMNHLTLQDKGNIIIQNAGNQSPHDRVSHPRKLKSSATLLHKHSMFSKFNFWNLYFLTVSLPTVHNQTSLTRQIIQNYQFTVETQAVVFGNRVQRKIFGPQEGQSNRGVEETAHWKAPCFVLITRYRLHD